MGNRKGKNTGRGGGGPRGARRDWNNIVKENEKLERYYNELGIIPEAEKAEFWDAMRRDLPNSFRFTGSKGHALAVQQRLKDLYIPEITSIKYEDELVEPPRPVPWYPDQLAWYMTTPKRIVRRFPPFASFQKFLVSETEVGNISRQEVVSMIPPLVLDVKPGVTVLDLCAAPGSKSAQLMELLHVGEEDAMDHVAQQVKNGVAGPEPIGPEGLSDDGRSTGLLIANDADPKRAHMLIHQMKRLTSPNLIVTNHDASIYPSIKIPQSQPGPPKYLKFDRILADVPCSGDGTPRKNFTLWQEWNPGSALALHAIQVRILVRALQMLKVGGRVVYSTCSMNPVEDEAVIATAIDRCGGSANVRIADCSDYLPGLKRASGIRSWKVMDREGHMWNSWEEIEQERQQNGKTDNLAKLAEGMFPPTGDGADLPLERCMRVYPHMQDTGGFFIVALEKLSEIRPKREQTSKVVPKSSVAALSDELDSKNNEMQPHQSLEKIGALDDLVTPNPDAQVEAEKNASVAQASHQVPLSTTFESPVETSPAKRTGDHTHVDHAAKRTKVEDGTDAVIGDRPVHYPFPPEEIGPVKTEDVTATPMPAPASQNATAEPRAQAQPKAKRKPGQPDEEPYKYVNPQHEELLPIYSFYQISDRFPKDRFMVRNAQAEPVRTVYYTSALARDILSSNEGQGLKIVHCGVRMFVKQAAQRNETCRWRIQAEGLRLIEPWLGPARSVTLTEKGTFHKLLVEMFPRIGGDCWKSLGEIGERARDISMGCSILSIEPSEGENGFSERMVFPLWRSVWSLNLMLSKEERRALLLRLYNDDTVPVNATDNRQPAEADTPSETGGPGIEDGSAAAAAAAGAAEAEENALQQENVEMGQVQQEETDVRETYTKAGDEEDRFNKTV